MTNTIDNNERLKYLQVGMQLAANYHGVTEYDLIKSATFVNGVLEDLDAQKAIAGATLDLFDYAGESRDSITMEFEKIAALTQPLSLAEAKYYLGNSLDTFSEIARIGRSVDILEKAANVMSVVPNILGFGAGLTPQVAKVIAGLSIASGLGIGGLTWYLDRDASQNEQDTEAKYQQAEYYKRLGKDLKRKIQEDQNVAKAQNKAISNMTNGFVI